MREFELIAVQMQISDGDPALNLDNAASLVASANPSKDAIVVLPELLNTGYDWNAISGLTEADTAEHLRQLSNISAKHGIFTIAGSIAEAVGDLRYNASYVFGPDGEKLGRYAKVHLFSPFGEDEHFVRGDSVLVAELSGALCGVSICYDLRFPELYRRQTLEGALLFAIPAVWPSKRGNIWKTLIMARAMEQQCFAVGVNRAGKDSDGVEYGGSLIVDPWGNVLAEAEGIDERVLKISADFVEADKARNHIPTFFERRPEVYRLDWDILAEAGADNCDF